MIQSDFQAEQAVIGDIILAPEKTLSQALHELSGEEFQATQFRTLFGIFRELFREKKPIDAVTVLAKAGEEYQKTVLDAAQNVPTLSNFPEYLRILKENFKRRKAFEKAMELMQNLESADLSQCLSDSLEISRSLMQEDKVRAVSAKDGFLDFCERKEKPKSYLKTGFYKLDKFTFIDYGDYIVVGGKPSSGKTAFTLQIMTNMSRGNKVIYFSLETSAEKIMDRIMANFTSTPFYDIKHGTIQKWDQIVDSYDRFKDLDFEIVESAGWSVDQIIAYATQKESKIIFIDYLSLIQSSGKSLYEKVTNISINLHTAAQRNKITIFALSQLNRTGQGEPDMASLRDSGQIEQDADCVLLLYQTDKDNPSASDRELIIAKNKEGSTGKILLSFQGAFQRFTQVETKF